MLRTQGKGDLHADMARLTSQIEIQQQAKLAELPWLVRADEVENEVGRCKAICGE